MDETKTYGIYFLVELTLSSGASKSVFMTGQFVYAGYADYPWSGQAEEEYQNLIQGCTDRYRNCQINKIHPPTILPI